MPFLISINWPSLVTEWVLVQKIYSKMYPVSCSNTRPDITDLVNHGMVKNTKTWISWEWNIIFLWNKKILNLCLRRHMNRSYPFVAEVTFKKETYETKFPYKLLPPLFFFLIWIHSMQGWTVTTRHRVTRKKKHKRIKAHMKSV